MCPAHVRPAASAAAAAEAAQRNWFLKIFHISIFRAPLPLLACPLRDCVGRAWFPPCCKLWTHIIIKATATATACAPCAASLCCLPYLVSCLLPLLLLWGGEAPRCGPSVLAFTVPTNNNQNILALPWQPQRNLGPQDKRSCWPGNCRRRCRRRNYRYLMQICVAYFVVGFFLLNKI